MQYANKTCRAATACYTLAALLLMQCGLAIAHQNTRAYGDLELTRDLARLTVFVRFDDWTQIIDLDLDHDGVLTKAELQPSASAIERYLLAAIVGWSDIVFLTKVSVVG